MRKKWEAAVSLLFSLVLAGSGQCAASAHAYDSDYLFRTEDYENFYEPATAQIVHDGHGNFSVRDAPQTVTSGDGYVTAIYPDSSVTGAGGMDTDYPDYPAMWQADGPYLPVGSFSGTGGYTGSAGMLYSDGSLGTVSFRGSTIRVYEGESLSNLLKGAGHFSGTSAWDGNVCMAGHNRGPNAHFYNLKDLREGDVITYATQYGTRRYQVYSARWISVDDYSPLDASYSNRLTLITCVANRPSLRLCVQAEQIS